MQTWLDKSSDMVHLYFYRVIIRTIIYTYRLEERWVYDGSDLAGYIPRVQCLARDPSRRQGLGDQEENASRRFSDQS
jgi:hypothetical protein